MYISVAIDGPAGSGKSTITKQVASELNFNYIDTGAMYRALTYNFIKNNLEQLDEEKIAAVLNETKFDVYFEDFKQKVIVNDDDVTDKIRTPEVSTLTSMFAQSKNVRDFLITTQRNLAESCNVIMDGRDIASVVLPNADVKIYLTASSEERARRRYRELEANGTLGNISLEELKKSIEERDFQDENRAIAPLVMVEDAIKVDTTSFTIEEVVAQIKAIIIEKVNS